MSGPIVPCLWIDEQAEAAARFYTKHFPSGRILRVSHFPSSGENPPRKPPGSVLLVDFEIGGLRFTALNGGPQFAPNPSLSFFVLVDTPAEADRLFGTLAQGGKTLMPLDSYPWSKRYGWGQDSFGVSWQVMASGGASLGTRVVPCLMFGGPQAGRAREAMKLYIRIFGGSIESAEHYDAGEGPQDSIKHGRFTLAGQPMVAMDSHVENGFVFNEGISLQVMCRDQAEIDRYWRELSAGGEESVCGWLKDRFGLSWQVVPEKLAEWMSSSNPAARDRTFAALLDMKKLDIGALQTAFDRT